jgi:hypothetical protein
MVDSSLLVSNRPWLSQQIAEWLQSDIPVLQIVGGGGSGKSRAISCLEAAELPVPVLAAITRERSGQVLRAVSVSSLNTLIEERIRNIDHYARVMTDIDPLFSVLTNLQTLVNLTGGSGLVFIDALDEADTLDRSRLYELAQAILDDQVVGVRAIFTTRPRTELSPSSLVRVVQIGSTSDEHDQRAILEPDQQDLRAFVEQAIPHQTAATEIVQRANGQWLFAARLLRSIKADGGALPTDGLPKGLEEHYGNDWRRIAGRVNKTIPTDALESVFGALTAADERFLPAIFLQRIAGTQFSIDPLITQLRPFLDGSASAGWRWSHTTFTQWLN